MTIHQYSNGLLTVPKSPKRMTEIYRNVSYRSFHISTICASVPFFCCWILLLLAFSCVMAATAQALSIKCLANNHRTITHIIPTEWRFIEKLSDSYFHISNFVPTQSWFPLDFVIVLWILCDVWFFIFPSVPNCSSIFCWVLFSFLC